MTTDTGSVRETLGRLSGPLWELYVKHAISRECRETPGDREEIEREEIGIAARWTDAEGTRFAAASSPKLLDAAIEGCSGAPGW